MQERRTTIRCECLERVQYCSANDPNPRDGRLTSITDRGLGLLAHEPHRVGERLTVSFSLPGEEQALTTTGLVRWTHQTPATKKWFSLGLEWLPLEDTTRFRIDTFLQSQSRAHRRGSLTGSRPWRGHWWKLHRVRWSTVALLSMGLAVALLAAAFSLQHENTQLADAIHQRNVAIAGLEGRDTRVRRALELTTARLADARSEVGRLTRKTNEFEAEVERMTGQVEGFQAAYTKLREEREQILRQVVTLEQERARMVRSLSAIPMMRALRRDAHAGP